MKATLNAFSRILFMHIKSTLSRPMVQVVMLVQPLVLATTTYILYKDSSVDNLVAFVVLSGGLSGVWSVLTFSSAGDIDRERTFGTLPLLMASPTTMIVVFAAKITANALISLSSLSVSFVYSWVLLGSALSLPHGYAFLSALAAFLVGANGFALFLSTIFFLSRSTMVMQNFLEYPLVMLGGIAFSINVLPKPIKIFSTFLPMRWGSEALRLTFNPGPLEHSFWILLHLSILVGLVYYISALFMLKLIEHRVRKEATLDLV